jgi:hypothetical protein
MVAGPGAVSSRPVPADNLRATVHPMPRSNPATHLRLGFAGHPDSPARHLSVDGMTPSGPNLSHWPGNRTPPRWKADLSTGIALNFSRAPAGEQQAFLAGAEVVLNDHYDTDGFLSLLAILRPEVAFAREELCLAAAATGDFGIFLTWRAFAIDRIVARLALPSARTLTDAAKSLTRYQWLLANAEEVLDQPERHEQLWRPEFTQVAAEIDAGREALERTLHREHGLSVLHSDGPRHRMSINTLAKAYRVLHVQHGADGTRFRYHDRTESWFELATFEPLPRRDLRPLAVLLQQLEGEPGPCRWCADPPTEPIPELYFGIPSTQHYGQITRTLSPSRLRPEQVERELLGLFRNSAPATSPAGKPQPQ